jgi:hypothetical protein
VGSLAQSLELTDHQSASLLLLVLGAFCSALFALVGWGVRVAVRREMDRLYKLEHRGESQQRFNERIIAGFAQIGIALRYPSDEYE